MVFGAECRKIPAMLKKQVVYCSLLFVAVNPLTENEEEGNQPRSYGGRGSAAYNQASEVVDQDDVVRLYLLQGEMANSYNEFLVGESIEDMRTYNNAQSLGQREVLAQALPYQNQGMGEGSIRDYLNNLIALYLQRITTLSKNEDNLDEALKEIEKIYIIDPHNKKAREMEKGIRALQRKKQPQAATVPSPPTAVQSERTIPVVKDFTDEKDDALASAETVMSDAVLSDPAVEKEELMINVYYVQGKTYLLEQEYLKACVAFKKVIALNPDHVYAEYARQFIDAAVQKIREKEERDLQVMRETKVMPSPIDTPPAVAPPQETPVSSAPVAIEVPAASSQHAKKREKDEKLYAQIENVLASVKRFIVEGHYGRARENLYAVLRLDPENEEARALIIELDRIMAEREQQKTASEERRIHDEQPREHYFAEQERRRAMRRKIEKKYTQWSEINDQAVHLEVNAKVAEKLYRAEKALVQKNYFGARQELDLLFVLAPDNVEGRALEAKLQNEIEYLQALIEDDVLALRERDQAPAVSDKNDNEQIITMTNDAVMAAETSQKSETEPPVEIARHETQKASGSATIETAYSEKTGRAQSSLFDVISNFRPFTLLTGEENTMQDVKVSEDEPVREKSVRKERTKRQRSVKDKKRVSENKSDTTSEAVLSNEVMPADEKCSKRKLLEYLTRGKRHFMQENYPLALVSFNKVKSLDKDGIYSSEVEKLIAITKKRLEKRK